MVIPYEAVLNYAWFRAWFHLVPSFSRHRVHVHNTYKLRTLLVISGLVPPWFHLAPHASACINEYSVQGCLPFGLGQGLVPLGSTILKESGSSFTCFLWLGSALVPLGSTRFTMHRRVFRSRLSAIGAGSGLGSMLGCRKVASAGRVGDQSDSAAWIVKKFSDVYLHETAVAHAYSMASLHTTRSTRRLPTSRATWKGSRTI